MFDFFAKVEGFLTTIFTFFVNLVDSLLKAVMFLTSSVTFSLNLVPFLPSIIGTAVVMFVAIYVIKFLIGR